MSDQATVTLGLVGLSMVVSGALLVVRRRLAAGVLLAAAGVLMVVAAALGSSGRHDAAEVIASTAGLAALPLALVAYPDVRRHRLQHAALGLLVVAVAVTAAVPRLDEVVGYLTVAVLVVHTWWRIETSTGPERSALLWMSTATVAVATIVGLVAFAADSDQTSGSSAFAVASLLACLIGPVLVVGVSQPDVVDVRGLVVRFAVFVTALLVDVALFMVLQGFLVALGADPSIGALALLGGLVAATFHPTQVLMRGVVDELLFGRRPDPLGAATSLAGLMGGDRDDPADPADLVEAIRRALVLPHVALVVDGQVVAASGAAVVHTRRVDLGGLGELVVGLRAGDLSMSDGDRRVIGLVVPLVVQNLRVRALAEQLQDSRERTITVVEEERRRLRRDLHDGLGPRLSGIAFSTDAVRNLLRSHPDQADELLRTMRAETSTAIDDIRRLVYAMRPPALDELGLVPALRQQTLGLRTPDGEALAVSLTAPVDLPALPAAVEVAAYRIVMEALTNVARHSAARSAVVALDHGAGGLAIDVRDSGGRASAGAWAPGVGLASMKERAAELGGALTAGPGADGGRVHAVLPL